MIFFFLLAAVTGFWYFTTATWPLYIDLVLCTVTVLTVAGMSLFSQDHDDYFLYKMLGGIAAGALTFVLLFLWGGLHISIFWYLASFVAAAVLCFIPGGFTIASFVLKGAGLCAAIPTWMLIIIVILDVLSLLMTVKLIKSKI